MGFKFRNTAVAFGLALGMLGATSAVVSAAECGTDKTIKIAEMSWPSAAALARIHARILKDGYGCDVEVVAGDTVPTTSSMLAKGTPAVAPELWISSIQEQWQKGEADGSVVSLGDVFKGGTIEGWFIPKYTKEAHPDLVTAEDVVNNPKIFPDPDDSSKGRFYSCPPGWACEIANANLFKAYDMENKDWNLFSPGSGGNLDASIARAFTRQQPILFYYWGPTAILGKYDTYRLEMPPYDAKTFECNSDAQCANPGKTSWPEAKVIIGAAAWLKKDAPNVADYFSNVAIATDQVNALLAWGDDNKADAQATAEHFLKDEQDVWTKWVPADVAEKVKASL